MNNQMNQLIEEDDVYLAEQIRNGDSDAFTKLYSKYFASLYFFVLNKTNDREVAKDIVQDLFAHIWNKGATLMIRDNVMSYLYTSAKNRVLDYYSKEKYRIAYLDYLEISDFEETYETDFLIREKMFIERMDQVLNTLSPRVKEVFELSRRHYLSHKEIAIKLSLSEHSVKTYIKDALKLIKMRLYAFPWILLLIYLKRF